MKRCSFSLLLVLCIQNVVAITYKYMDEMCDSDLDLARYNSARLKLTADSFYNRMNCYVRVKTTSSSRIMFYFKSFSVSCSDDGLLVRDGSGPSSDYVSGLNGKNCGFSISSNVFKTSGNYLYLKFSSRSLSWYSGFDMVITSYHTGSCDSDEYSCSNGRCISDTLTCNGNNPCGDYSDCAYIIAAGVIAGIVVGSIALIAIVVSVVVIICRRRRIAYAGRTVRQPVGVVTTTTATTGFGQPFPQQYPTQTASAYPVGQQYPDKPYSQY